MAALPELAGEGHAVILLWHGRPASGVLQGWMSCFEWLDV